MFCLKKVLSPRFGFEEEKQAKKIRHPYEPGFDCNFIRHISLKTIILQTKVVSFVTRTISYGSEKNAIEQKIS